MARRYRTGRVSVDTVNKLIAHAEFLFWVPSGTVRSTSKRRRHSAARAAVVLVLADHLDVSFPEIGRKLGRDGSSMFGAHARASMLCATDAAFARKVRQMAALLVQPERLAA